MLHIVPVQFMDLLSKNIFKAQGTMILKRFIRKKCFPNFALHQANMFHHAHTLPALNGSKFYCVVLESCINVVPFSICPLGV